jgi:hypothetical protein
LSGNFRALSQPMFITLQIKKNSKESKCFGGVLIEDLKKPTE